MWDRKASEAPLDPDHAKHWASFRAEVGEGVWSRLRAYDDSVKANLPAPPFWYLGVLATHPDMQGRGPASAVLAPALAAADADGWDCWLETSTPSNGGFYARRGFTEAVPVTVPDGPPTWWLRRPGVTATRC